MYVIAVAQLHTDWVWGMCVDAILKWHMAYDAPVYMYEFAHRSEFEYLPVWMGEHVMIVFDIDIHA